MRRVIKGKLYDTTTASLIARDIYTIEKGEEEGDVEEKLYRTPGGAFFLVTGTSGPDVDEENDPIYREKWNPITRTAAEQWFNAGAAIELFEENVFSTPDEATAEDEQERTISLTVRVPSDLRDRLAQTAKKENISMNAYMVRCAKRCLES